MNVYHHRRGRIPNAIKERAKILIDKYGKDAFRYACNDCYFHNVNYCLFACPVIECIHKELTAIAKSKSLEQEK